MKQMIQSTLIELAPYFVAACAVLLIFVYGELKRANRYLRYLSVLAHRQTGEDWTAWEDVGK